MPDGMIQKERKKRIIKQAAMKAILVIILVCIAMITFLLLFQVRKIEVSGNQYLSRQEIADWVQDDNWSVSYTHLPCTCPSTFPVCVCGKVSKGKVITKKPILPSEEEMEVNSRSKSAKLRIFERV